MIRRHQPVMDLLERGVPLLAALEHYRDQRQYDSDDGDGDGHEAGEPVKPIHAGEHMPPPTRPLSKIARVRHAWAQFADVDTPTVADVRRSAQQEARPADRCDDEWHAVRTIRTAAGAREIRMTRGWLPGSVAAWADACPLIETTGALLAQKRMRNRAGSPF